MTNQEAQTLIERFKPFLPYIGSDAPEREEVTPESAELWAVRLVRIWSPEGNPTPRVICRHCRHSFLFEERFEGDIHLHFIHTVSQNHVDLVSGRSLFLKFSTRPGAQCGLPEEYSQQLAAHHKPLVDKWMPFFRRGCWLSGLPVEATAHEKAEWMQGFTQQEIEAWNLTM